MSLYNDPDELSSSDNALIEEVLGFKQVKVNNAPSLLLNNIKVIENKLPRSVYLYVPSSNIMQIYINSFPWHAILKKAKEKDSNLKSFKNNIETCKRCFPDGDTNKMPTGMDWTAAIPLIMYYLDTYLCSPLIKDLDIDRYKPSRLLVKAVPKKEGGEQTYTYHRIKLNPMDHSINIFHLLLKMITEQNKPEAPEETTEETTIAEEELETPDAQELMRELDMVFDE